MGDGDGWVFCAQGHRHWGRLGAAGLLLLHRGRVVLQHRAERTHEGNTWGVPGGARDSHEDVVQTALREATEEADIDPSDVDPIGTARLDHGGWSYTTVVAGVRGPIRPRAVNWESTDVRWWDAADVERLTLHPGFGASWPALRQDPRPVTIVVDMANAVGARPDGWWRDRLGATTRLAERVAGLTRSGIEVRRLPAAVDAGPLDRILPRLVLVVEGAATGVLLREDHEDHDSAGTSAAAGIAPAAGTPNTAPPGTPATEIGPPWWHGRTTVIAAPGAGDDAIVAQAAHAGREGGTVLVVTADRALRARLSPAVVSTGPSWLYGLLPSARDA